MSLNSTPSSERLQIGFFGLRNAGKSSVVNAVTGQQLSVVSDVKGTTTDPVKKSMELLPLGPVVIIDTPGYDDEGDLGALRVNKTKEILKKTDVAVLVVDVSAGVSECDKELISLFTESNIPYIIAYNKSDLLENFVEIKENEIYISAVSKYNIKELKDKIASIGKGTKINKPLIDDIIKKGDLVLLVTPIDNSAPKGRIILPQQTVLRNILDCGCTAVVCKETELEATLGMFAKKPDLVITDSQVFGFVDRILPKEIRLTSFSIIFARYKGDLNVLVKGAATLKKLQHGDKILIAEGCTHHRQCNDIGTVKMPGWIKSYTGKDICFDFVSGGEFPENLNDYKLVVHCGACMLGEKEMNNRIKKCIDSDVPMVNYGVAIAAMHGILKRSLEVFPEALKIID